MAWYVYILRCGDGTLYTGMTDDVQRRLDAHRTGKGAKYTRGRGPLELAYTEEQPDKSAALRRGDIRYRASDGPLLAFTRTCGEETVLAALNAGDQAAVLRLEDGERVQPLLGAARLQTAPQGQVLTLPPRTGSLLRLLDGLEEDQAYAD